VLHVGGVEWSLFCLAGGGRNGLVERIKEFVVRLGGGCAFNFGFYLFPTV
jgi:hypothetical protein